MVSVKKKNHKCSTYFLFFKTINSITIQTNVRAALIGLLDPTTALMEAEAIRPAIVFYDMINKFISKLFI